MYAEKEIQSMLEEALDNLADSVKKLLTKTMPETPMPRPRVFTLMVAKSGDDRGMVAEWPAHRVLWNNPVIRWEFIVIRSPKVEGRESRYNILPKRERHALAYHLARLCSTPRNLVSCLSNIRAAAVWCEDRAKGRQKQAEEILKQQGKCLPSIEE